MTRLWRPPNWATWSTYPMGQWANGPWGWSQNGSFSGGNPAWLILFDHDEFAHLWMWHPTLYPEFLKKIGYTIPCSGLESRILSLNTCHKLGHSMSHVPFAPPRSWSLQLSFVPPQWRRPPNLAQDICRFANTARDSSRHIPRLSLYFCPWNGPCVRFWSDSQSLHHRAQRLSLTSSAGSNGVQLVYTIKPTLFDLVSAWTIFAFPGTKRGNMILEYVWYVFER